VDLHVEWFDSTAAGVIKPTGLGWANEGGFIWDALKK
jgi:hypothetical protein